MMMKCEGRGKGRRIERGIERRRREREEGEERQGKTEAGAVSTFSVIQIL